MWQLVLFSRLLHFYEALGGGVSSYLFWTGLLFGRWFKCELEEFHSNSIVWHESSITAWSTNGASNPHLSFLLYRQILLSKELLSQSWRINWKDVEVLKSGKGLNGSGHSVRIYFIEGMNDEWMKEWVKEWMNVSSTTVLTNLYWNCPTGSQQYWYDRHTLGPASKQVCPLSYSFSSNMLRFLSHALVLCLYNSFPTLFFLLPSNLLMKA